VTALGRALLFAAEIIVLSALILTTRCANYQDVFIGNHIYFTDADCYARMTRVRLCGQHPGLILRHHAFENFPDGTTPHTTAPLDYLILGFSLGLRPFTSRPIDMAGALISPLFGLVAGIFLAWWARRFRLPFRWAMLGLFALSPILVHGTELGRPDHQSLVLLLIIVAVGADWFPAKRKRPGWGVVSGLAWGLAVWVSLYEPLILFLLSSAAAGVAVWLGVWEQHRNDKSISMVSRLTTEAKRQFTAPAARARWIAFVTVLVVAALIERRVPSLPKLVNDPTFRNWSRTIGELIPVPLLNPVWFTWTGWLMVAAPVFVVLWVRRSSHRNLGFGLTLLLVATFGLTVWQARWGYFFAVFFAMSLPDWLSLIRSRILARALFVASLWPILREWDERIWPNEGIAAHQSEQRHEAVELRELSGSLISVEQRAFLAPWWLSPAISYWSGQPAVAGSSHESLPGIVDTARFFLCEDPVTAGEILQRRKVAWVIAYDAERVEKNSSMILGKGASNRCLGRGLDRRPGYAPRFLTLVSQNGTAKIFEVSNKW
jgi:MFS family permease